MLMTNVNPFTTDLPLATGIADQYLYKTSPGRSLGWGAAQTWKKLRSEKGGVKELGKSFAFFFLASHNTRRTH